MSDSGYHEIVNSVKKLFDIDCREILVRVFPYFCLALALSLIYISYPGYQIKNININITSPTDGDSVLGNFRVNGTISKDLPEGYHLWIALKPESESHWWPQGDGTTIPSNGIWHVNAFINTKKDGEKFIIAAILANEKNNLEFLGWLDQGRYSGKYPGIELPIEIIIKNTTTVKSVGMDR